MTHKKALDTYQDGKRTTQDQPVHIRNHQRPEMAHLMTIKRYDLEMIGANTPTIHLFKTNQASQATQQRRAF
jgi:hypothetical protein